MNTVFWIVLILILYCYFGYPVLLDAFAKLRCKEIGKGKITPSVSIVFSVFNEDDVINDKIENLLDLDYPTEKVEILVGSDGSEDKTNQILESFHDKRLKIFTNKQRLGKMATLNNLVSHAENEILIFTDARQIFEKRAVKELVANFHDKDIGCVSGELIFSEKEGATAKGINLYWNYEKNLRKNESALHSMLGATGAIYAVRKELYTPIPENIILDDVYIPLKIVQKGYRAIFDDSAKAYDEVADSPREEYRRKARTLFGNYQIFRALPWIFNPLKSPVAIQFISHKLLRLLVPFLLIILFVVNILLLEKTFYKYFLLLQIIFYLMACVGALARHQKYGILNILSRVCYVPYIFCLLNFSALIGFLRFAGASQKVTWKKARVK